MPMQCYVHVKSQFRGKNSSSIEKFPSLVLPGNTTTVTASYYPISFLLSVSGRLREVKNKRTFQTFSSKSGRGRLNCHQHCQFHQHFGGFGGEYRRNNLPHSSDLITLVRGLPHSAAFTWRKLPTEAG